MRSGRSVRKMRRAWRTLARLMLPVLAAGIASKRQSTAGSRRARAARSPSIANTVCRYFVAKALASIVKRICGPPTAKVEKTCSRWRFMSLRGMHREGAAHELGPIGHRMPAEIAGHVRTVEVRDQPARAQVAQARPGIGSPGRPLDQRLQAFDGIELHDRLTVVLERTAGCRGERADVLARRKPEIA